MSETIQVLTSLGALLLGAAYVVGGLIVNLHLGRYGITEYQVLRVSYLVAGLIYIALTLIAFALAVGAIFVALTFNVGTLMVDPRPLLIVSLLSVIALLYLRFRQDTVLKRFRLLRQSLINHSFLSIVSLLFPAAILFRQGLGASDPASVLYTVLAVLVVIPAFFAQLFYYAVHVYGNPDSFDRIGMGIPSEVQLAAEVDSMKLLVAMGIPAPQQSEGSILTDKVLMLDETDAHYIVGLGQRPKLQAVKIDKALVKGIVYHK